MGLIPLSSQSHPPKIEDRLFHEVKSPGAAFINTTNPFDLKVGYPMGLKRGFDGI
jgi:hypothetical protein